MAVEPRAAQAALRPAFWLGWIQLLSELRRNLQSAAPEKVRPTRLWLWKNRSREDELPPKRFCAGLD